jgi:hypothetical protein
MKKLLVMIVVMAIAAPLFAADVDFAAVDNQNGTCTVTYTVNAGTIRGMALNVDADAALTDVAVDSFFDVFMDAAYMDPGAYTLGAGTPIADQAAAGEVAVSASFCISMGNLEGVATANTIVLSGPDCTGTIDINTLRGAVVNTDGVAMTTNLPINFTITTVGGCACLGDIASANSIGAPDGQVDTGDLQNLVGKLLAVGAPYIISPIPAELVCMDIAGSNSLGDPDGQVDTGDLQNLVGYLLGVGAPYIGGCM